MVILDPMLEGDLVDEDTGERIGPATQEHIKFSKGMIGGVLYLRPDGTPSGHSSSGKWRRVRVETRLSAADIANAQLKAATYAAQTAKTRRRERWIMISLMLAGIWFAFAIVWTIAVSLFGDDAGPSRPYDQQEYPDLCWTQSGQEPC